MRFGDVLFGMFVLILIYLLAVNWKGVNQLVATGASASIGMVRTLQGR